MKLKVQHFDYRARDGATRYKFQIFECSAFLFDLIQYTLHGCKTNDCNLLLIDTTFLISTLVRRTTPTLLRNVSGGGFAAANQKRQ